MVVESLEECLELLRLGELNRHYAETKMNHQSSRSHTIFRLHIESVTTTAESFENHNVFAESILVRNWVLIDLELCGLSRIREGEQSLDLRLTNRITSTSFRQKISNDFRIRCRSGYVLTKGKRRTTYQ